MAGTKRSAGFTLWIVLVLSVGAVSVQAQESFYKGKTMRIIVGAPPGGGFDAYARMISRHMGSISPVTRLSLSITCPGRG